LTPTEAHRLFEAYGLAPRRSAGQNLVVDPNTVDRIVAAARLREDDTVVEVGPGFGSLTFALADVAAHVLAIEIDAGFVTVLRDRAQGRADVEVVHADALRVDLAALLGERHARLVANLPYNVATPLLMHAMACPAIDDAFVMVQREVGERWCAPAGDRGRAGISVKLDLIAQVEIAFAIPRTVFFPVPNVDSVMVRVTRRAEVPPPEEQRVVFALVEAAFSQRRKTLRNTLRRVGDIEVLETAAAEAGVDLGARAETLPTEAFRRLAAAVVAGGGSI
jgi:16S rRNA (adenine1518-N6/adenine1519-N6)-dimethyltransferase